MSDQPRKLNEKWGGLHPITKTLIWLAFEALDLGLRLTGHGEKKKASSVLETPFCMYYCAGDKCAPCLRGRKPISQVASHHLP